MSVRVAGVGDPVVRAAAAVAFATPSRDVDRLVAALLGPTPLEDDLRALTDEIGGRPTGSPANWFAWSR